MSLLKHKHRSGGGEGSKRSNDPSFNCGNNQPGCGVFNADNIHRQWPDIKFMPRPRPTQKAALGKWEQEYKYWKRLKCGRGLGYFCQRHGMWVECRDVESGDARPQNREDGMSCPHSHGARDSALEMLGAIHDQHAEASDQHAEAADQHAEASDQYAEASGQPVAFRNKGKGKSRGFDNSSSLQPTAMGSGYADSTSEYGHDFFPNYYSHHSAATADHADHGAAATTKYVDDLVDDDAPEETDSADYNAAATGDYCQDYASWLE